MKYIILLLMMTFSLQADELVTVRHNGRLLKFIYSPQEGLRIDLNQRFRGGMLVNDIFTTKKNCRDFKTYMKILIRDRDPESLERKKFAQLRGLALNSLGDNLHPFEIKFLPFGVELTDRSLHLKLAQKLNLSVDNPIFSKINENLNFVTMEIDYSGGLEEILSVYSREVVHSILSSLSNEIVLNYQNTDNLKKGSFSIKTGLFETTCDLLYNGSSLTLIIKAQENDRIAERVQVPKGDIQYLFRALEKASPIPGIRLEDRDSFVAGMEMASAINKSGFVYPARLKQVFGKKHEIDFFKSLFGDKRSWLLGKLTNERTKRIILNSTYIKTEPGKKFEGVSLLDVGTF